MYIYEEIRDELKKNRYVIYKVNKKDIDFGFKFNGKKSELKEKIIKKYLKRYKPDTFFVCFKFTFHTGTKDFQGGPIAVDLSTFAFIDNELVDGYSKGEICRRFIYQVWFPRTFLKNYGWKDSYLENIISKIITNKVEMKPLVVNSYIKFSV